MAQDDCVRIYRLCWTPSLIWIKLMYLPLCMQTIYVRILRDVGHFNDRILPEVSHEYDWMQIFQQVRTVMHRCGQWKDILYVCRWACFIFVVLYEYNDPALCNSQSGCWTIVQFIHVLGISVKRESCNTGSNWLSSEWSTGWLLIQIQYREAKPHDLENLMYWIARY